MTLRVLHSRLASRFNKLRYQTTPLLAATVAATPNHDEPPPPAPPPIRVSLTESAGRGVFATRTICAGDLIHTAKPFVSHPAVSAIQAVCYFCLRKAQRSMEVEAEGVAFCSDECREQAKDFHEVETKADWLAYNDYCRTNGLKYPLLVKRLACMVISGTASADSLDILQPASLSPEMILEMEKGFGLLRSTLTRGNIIDEQMAFLSKEWYTSVLTRIRINAFRIEIAGGSYEDLLSLAAASVESEAAVGNAVYILPSFYNHDCDPNAHIMWIENADARLKDLRDIDAGEELRICYIDTSMDRDARQSILSQGFGFQWRLGNQIEGETKEDCVCRESEGNYPNRRTTNAS